MFKVLLISGLIALSSAASLFVDETGSGETGSGETLECLYENQLWGSADGTKFYFCLDSNTVIEQNCAPNTFFVRNSTACGCVPLDLVDTHCVNLEEVGPCTGENMQQPQPAKNPTDFYICPSLNASPVLLTCPENKAFIKQDGYLGCFDWVEWRQLRDCPQ